MARREFKWTELQLTKLNKVQEVLIELEDYKPLTLRQIYYQLVGKGYIENKTSQYTMLSNLLKWARIVGYIPWEDIEDRVRVYHDLTGWGSSDRFIQASLSCFLSGYRRDLLQTQDRYIEIWIEKDALSAVFTRAAEPYTIPVVVCRGFSSVSFLNDFRERLSYHEGQSPIMLYFGDFDPSGVEMLDSMKITLEDEIRVTGVEFKRIALLREDIFEYKLPHNPNAIKKDDRRKNKHIAKYGELAVELDALKPDVLVSKIKGAIEAELDADAFKTEVETEAGEFDKLNMLRQDVIDYLNGDRRS